MLNLKLYPRGFVGGTGNTDVGGGKAPTMTHQFKIASNTYEINMSKSQGTRAYDTRVSSLCRSYKYKQGLMNTFNFRESILIKAKEMFSISGGLDSFKQFIICQLKFGELTPNHIDCLKDVCNFIITGKNYHSILMWERLLEDISGNDIIAQSDRDDLINVFSQVRDPCFSTVNGTIIKWVSNPNGYSHLLKTLWLLYGEHLQEREP